MRVTKDLVSMLGDRPGARDARAGSMGGVGLCSFSGPLPCLFGTPSLEVAPGTSQQVDGLHLQGTAPPFAVLRQGARHLPRTESNYRPIFQILHLCHEDHHPEGKQPNLHTCPPTRVPALKCLPPLPTPAVCNMSCTGTAGWCWGCALSVPPPSSTTVPGLCTRPRGVEVEAGRGAEG